MGEEPRELTTRQARLRAYLHHNRERILVDLIVMIAWIVAAWGVFGALGLPQWLFYLGLFLGIIVYSRVTAPWERPYMSPDLDPDSEELEERDTDGDGPE